MRVIADANDEYLIRRADELLRGMLIGEPDTNLDMAISLLGLLRARYNERVQTKSN